MPRTCPKFQTSHDAQLSKLSMSIESRSSRVWMTDDWEKSRRAAHVAIAGNYRKGNREGDHGFFICALWTSSSDGLDCDSKLWKVEGKRKRVWEEERNVMCFVSGHSESRSALVHHTSACAFRSSHEIIVRCCTCRPWGSIFQLMGNRRCDKCRGEKKVRDFYTPYLGDVGAIELALTCSWNDGLVIFRNSFYNSRLNSLWNQSIEGMKM